MSPSRKVAEEFIRDQVRIMGEHGRAPKLSAKRFQEAVAETERSFASLRPNKGRVGEPPSNSKTRAASKR
jgi:hypothetical protein